MRGKPRLVAFSTGAWGLVVSAVLAIGSRDWLLEEWYLHKLMTGSLKDMEAAAGKLGKMKSSRTLPSLLRGMWDACGEAKESSGARGSFCQAAIIRIGAPAMVYLIDSLDDRNPEFSLWAARTLEDIYLERPPSPKMRAPAQKGYDVKNFQKVTLQLLYHDEALGDGVRQAALEALKKL